MSKLLSFILITILFSSCSSLVGTSRSVASVNSVRDIYVVGDIKSSLLTAEQFREKHGAVWALMDGGADFNKLSEENPGLSQSEFPLTSIPDARGKFLRMQNNGIASALGNPENTALGGIQSDQLKTHSHKYDDRQNGSASWGLNTHAGGNGFIDKQRTSHATGGQETRPKNVTVNFFVKVSSCTVDMEGPCL
jgi:hypothetical protein